MRTAPGTAGQASRGPASVPLAERAGGPDLARGLALAGIALANTVGWLHGHEWTVLLKQQDATGLDKVADVLLALLVDNRGFPLFAMLFGYGLGILHRRSLAAGESPGRFLRRMLRRHAVLLVIGLLHGILLFQGDILAAYAVIGMLCAVLMTRGRALLPIAGALCLPALAVWGWADATIGFGGGSGYAAASAPDYLTGVALRAPGELRGAALAVVLDIGLLAPMALGALLARLRLFEEVAENRDLLVPMARWGIVCGALGAAPLTAVLLLDPAHENLADPTAVGIMGVVHQLTGLLGALGLAAAAALLADRVRTAAHGGPALPRLVTAAVHGVEALGAVSLSAYLAQSVLFLALFPPYTLDLGARLGSAGACAIALAGWLVMIPLAAALRRAGRRGPMELVLRTLAGSTSPRPAGGER